MEALSDGLQEQLTAVVRKQEVIEELQSDAFDKVLDKARRYPSEPMTFGEFVTLIGMAYMLVYRAGIELVEQDELKTVASLERGEEVLHIKDRLGKLFASMQPEK